LKAELAKLAREALATSEFKQFGDALSTQALPESFGVLTDSALMTKIAVQLRDGDPMHWITRARTWDASLYHPSIAFDAADNLLHLLWQDLSTRLARKVDAVAHRTPLAARGAVLCFFGRAQFSIVVEYTRSGGGAVSLRPLAALADPNGVFELSNLLDGATPEIRNAVKNAAMSVDKLVFQRGSIVHVDRQREDVFGPTIDTVILGELVAEWLDTKTRESKVVALEIGPGSGLLSVLLGSSDCVRALIAVDLNDAAVTCTLKNLKINDITLDAKHQRVRVRAEKFDPAQLVDQFDFIVCNPPYIPDVPDAVESTSPSMKEYDRAVGGLDLCLEILGNLPELLAPKGVLLLMTSSVSDREVMACLPDGFEASPALGADGRRVPLDVDVVWRRQEWRDWLLSGGRIERDERGGLWHRLRPFWVKRKEG
jgi:tRNA1(Val) A37 N6-methylase TrmN6